MTSAVPPGPPQAQELRRWVYHLVVLALGIVVLAAAGYHGVSGGSPDWRFWLALAIGVPLIIVIARFPMVLDSGAGGMEVGFDSSILMFLLCTLDTSQALMVWSAGVVLTQLSVSKSASSRVFNIGVGIVAGGLAAAVYAYGTGDAVGTPRELVAVGAAAAVYFICDLLLSALSVSIASAGSLVHELRQPGTLLAIACFVPFDSLGYLGAVVQRASPWWTLTLLGVPLATLLVATRAVTRGRENARRLTVLFRAAVRAQTLLGREEVVEALLADSRELLRLPDVRLETQPPTGGEIGAEAQLGRDQRWLVARALNRARSTVAADEQALRALAAVASDAVARQELTDEMVHVARHDPLTDLPNRGILLDRVTVALESSRRGRVPVALLFLDLDGFKPVNDRFGHAAGDRVLVQLAERLRGCVLGTGMVARLGGDEFAVLFEGLDRDGVREMCDRIMAVFDEGVGLGGQRIRLSASLGLAFGSGDDSAASLLRNADLAMYEAKATGKGRYVEYADSLGRARLERLELVDDLRTAVAAGAIDVVYQPVIALSTGRIVGVEALARWSRDGQPVPPDVFIPVAEETGLIVALGEVVLDRVAADSAALRAAIARDHLKISVNISAGQLREPGFVETVAGVVSRIPDSPLVLEITERQGVDLAGGVLETMRAIAELGVVFAIDDFGVGFSSISYLHDLPARILKADAALSAEIDRDDRARALLRSVVLMGQALGYDVVIEGIERSTQLDVLGEDAPETFVQGYYFHRPMPLEQLVDVLVTR